MPGMDAVTIRRDVQYRATDRDVLAMDVYYPPDTRGQARLPAVVFVNGYFDAGVEKMLGCKLKEMASYISWGQLAATSGMVAITHTTGQEPAADAHALLRYIQQSAAELRIDENRIGLWACSGNVPNALSLLMSQAADHVKCAVLCYGFMLDLAGNTTVATAAQQWGFVNPSAGRSIAELPRDIPLFVVRAGRDETPHLNATMDCFLTEALSCNQPITLVNYPAGPHAFDIMDESDASRETIKQMLAFMRLHLVV